MRIALTILLLTTACHRKLPSPTPPDLSTGWVNLTPGMVLKLESAYFKDGAKVRNVETYIGTELLSLLVQPNGALRPIEHKTLPTRPPAQPAVATLIPEAIRRHRAHRFHFQVVVDRATGKASAVLLSAPTKPDLDKLNPATPSKNQTVIPESTSASLAMQITINKKPTVLLWGTTLASQLGQRTNYTLLRQGKPITLPPNRPLLPNDELTW